MQLALIHLIGNQPGHERPQLLVTAQLLRQGLKDVFACAAQFHRCPLVQYLMDVHGDGQLKAYSLGSHWHGGSVARTPHKSMCHPVVFQTSCLAGRAMKNGRTVVA